MLSQELEVFFGGAAGGGKSDALLMAALMFSELPGYAAIIFRRTYPELSLPGGLLDRAADWLGGTDARWNSTTKTWTFPSSATLSFGHMENEMDKFNYKSSEFHYIGFDELTSFTETQYTYLFSRLRRQIDSFIPLRMRSASNPGDIGHVFVKKRFVQPAEVNVNRRFVPSLLQDNPYIDESEYTASLMNLDAFTRNQLLKGIWTDFKGNHFLPSNWQRHKFMGDSWWIGHPPTRRVILHCDFTIIVAVDWAMKEKKENDATAITVAGIPPGGLTINPEVFIFDCVNRRMRPEERAFELNKICERWKPHVVASDDDVLSLMMLNECRRQPHIPEVQTMPIRGRTKLVRAQDAIIYGENGRIYLPEQAAWLDEFCDQLSAFTGLDDPEDDIVDTLGIICRKVNALRAAGSRFGFDDEDTAPGMLLEGKATW